MAHEDGQVTGVNHAKLVPLLIEAVKEQQATIDEQQARLEALERLLDQRQP